MRHEIDELKAINSWTKDLITKLDLVGTGIDALKAINSELLEVLEEAVAQLVRHRDGRKPTWGVLGRAQDVIAKARGLDTVNQRPT